jgi:hypothetical protein
MKFAIVFILLLAGFVSAQQTAPALPDPPEDVASDVYSLRELAKEDRTAIDALVLYPEDVFLAVMEISRQPEIVVRLSRIQKTSTASFRKITSCVTPAEQRMAWDIARYPGLAADLMDSDRSTDAFQKILLKYPTAVHSAAMALATRRADCDILVNLYHLQNGVDEAFHSTIADYPETTRDAATLLVTYPEILSLLGDYMDQTILIGDIYRKNPAFIKKRGAEIRKEVEAKSAASLESWRSLLASTPAAIGELTQAAAAFAAEMKRDAQSRETGALAGPPYSYWFGIPEGSAGWHSHPDYFLWGFYYDPSGAPVLASLPSSEFILWLDPKKYPQLAGVVLKQYRANEGMSGGFYTATRSRIESIREAPPAQPSEAARRLAESVKLADPTAFHKEYQASDYWMSTTYQAIKATGGLSGERKY